MTNGRVAIVGGGAVGVTAATDLARAGVDVTLFERDTIASTRVRAHAGEGESQNGNTCESGSTGRAAGICYDAFADRLDAMVAERALERFRTLAAETAISVTDHPYVWLAREGDETRAKAIREQVSRMQAADNGRDVSLLDAAELDEQFPALRTDDVAVAAIARCAVYTEPSTYATVMAERAQAAGATIQTNTAVELTSEPAIAIETPDGTESFDAVLVAAGAHTKPLLAAAGVSIPVKPYRVQALVTERIDESQQVPMLYDATQGFYCRPKDDGLLAGDGTEKREFDPDDWDQTADETFVNDTLDCLRDALTTTTATTTNTKTDTDTTTNTDTSTDIDRLSPSHVRDAWAGLCTATPDRDPLLGEIEPGLFVAVGWHGHGFMRAPALGEAIASAICENVDRSWDEVLSAFDPRRFDGDESFPVIEGMTVD